MEFGKERGRRRRTRRMKRVRVSARWRERLQQLCVPVSTRIPHLSSLPCISGPSPYLSDSVPVPRPCPLSASIHICKSIYLAERQRKRKQHNALRRRRRREKEPRLILGARAGLGRKGKEKTVASFVGFSFLSNSTIEHSNG